MTSPAKLLLLAICTAALIAHFGDKLAAITGDMAGSRMKAEPQSANSQVYAKTTNGYYGGEVYIAMSRDGHYWATLEVNGTPVRFVIDTGASHVSLSYEDAEMAGLDPSGLNYDRAFKTAGGISRKAIVTLDRITLDSIQISNISASVSQPGQINVSLLGMNFLNKLSGFNVENRKMILRP